MSHFYTKTENGIEPRHFVKMSKDPTKTRPSRTTDAKKAFKESNEVWLASVTTVLNILDKPALLNWKVDKHLEQAHDLYAKAAQSDIVVNFDNFKNVVKAKTREEMDKAPQAGTDIHKVLEDYFTDVSTRKTDIELKICKAVEEKFSEVGLQFYQCEKYFADSELGYAGCADIIGTAKGGMGWVIDYKSKQTADKFKPGKMAYPEHYRQLAAYGFAEFRDKPFRAANIFICLETGEIDFHEHSQEDLMKGWLDFQDCLSIYQRNVYDHKSL